MNTPAGTTTMVGQCWQSLKIPDRADRGPREFAQATKVAPTAAITRSRPDNCKFIRHISVIAFLRAASWVAAIDLSGMRARNLAVG